MVLKNSKLSKKGFTIVELLVVIVVIGILAAITVVSYTGVTSKANTASAQSAANGFISKAEAYSAELGSYPATFSALTGATQDKVYALTGVTMLTAAPTSAPANNNAVIYYRNCTGGGIQVGYWNYSSNAINYIQSGVTSGGSATVSATACTVQAT